MEANNYGGAIRIQNSKNHEIVGSDFINNYAESGGAIAVLGDNTVVERIFDCRFQGNTVPMEVGFHMGGAIYSASLIKAIDACTFEDNEGWHGDDIYSDGMATTVIRNSNFNTQETNNKARVVGPILACDSPFAFGICPETLKTCEDTAREKSSYGVKCGKRANSVITAFRDHALHAVEGNMESTTV